VCMCWTRGGLCRCWESSMHLSFLQGQHQPTVEKEASSLDESSIRLSFGDVRDDQSFTQGPCTAGDNDNGIILLKHASIEQFVHGFRNEFITTFQGIHPDRMHTKHDTGCLATGHQVGAQHQCRNTGAVLVVVGDDRRGETWKRWSNFQGSVISATTYRNLAT